MNQNTVLRIQNSGVRNQESPIIAYVFFLTLLITVYCSPLAVSAEDNPLNKMLDETMSYFKPLSARVITAEDKKITVNIGAKDGVRKGMRFQVFREEAPFRHPVTKEPFGKLESLVGKVEIKEVSADSSRAEIFEGGAKEGDKIRISEIKVNVLFCQSKDTDWHLADSYYRMMKDSGRFNLIETGMDTDIPSKAVEEARRLRAEVALLLVVRKSDAGTVLTQSLFWVSDGVQLSEVNVNIDAAFSKKLGTSDLFFKPVEQEALQFEAPSDGKFISVCDLDGKGKKEILIATGKDVRAYTIGGSLEPYSGGVRIAGAAIHNPIWLDCIDLNKDGRDEIVVTTMASGTGAEDPEQLSANRGDKAVTSYIYAFTGSEFVLLHKDSVFLRRMGHGLIGQEFSRYEGFFGDVFDVTWDGGYQRGKALPLPKGVNIYDFIYLEDSRDGRMVLAYDEAGFLNLYDSRGMRIWRSKTDNGGFINSFAKKASSVLADKGEWSMKDRLSLKDNKVLSIKRVPFVEMMKGIGFKKAEIKTFWWNGFSVDEKTLIDNIGGTLYDYAVDGDEVIVLASPLFGIKAGNILKGENPLKTELSVYKMKGK